MNILLTIRYKDLWYSLPLERRTEIVTATVAFHDRHLKAGKLKDTYTFGDGKLMSVWDVASFEEMLSILLEHPYSGFVDFDPAPFLDHKAVVKLIAERREAARKAAKK